MANYFLSSGELHSLSGCTVGDYVIDWRKGGIDGDVVFTSAAPNNFNFNTTHPFNQEVVESGTLYPVIRYAILNQQKYSAEPMIGSLLSTDFKTCLSGQALTIDEINCTTQYNQDENYNYQLHYDRTEPSEEKIRSFNFYVESQRFLGFYFRADDIADQLKIKYCTPSNPDGILIENFVVGRSLLNAYDTNTTRLEPDHFPVDYPNTPKFHNSSGTGPNIYNVMDLDLITTNNSIVRGNDDWLRIDIISSFNNFEYNETIWDFGIQCLDNHLPVSDYTYETELDMSSLTPNVLNYVSNTAGTYKLDFKNKGIVEKYQYNDYYGGGSQNSFFDAINRSIYLDLTYNCTIGEDESPRLDQNNYSTTTIEKTVGHLKIIFTDSELYQLYVSKLNNILIYLIVEGGYDDSLTDDNYKYFCDMQVGFYENGENCGDDKTFRRFYIHPSSTFEWGNGIDSNEINISLAEIQVNNLDQSDTCIYNVASIIKSNINDTYNSTNSFISKCYTEEISYYSHFKGRYIKRLPPIKEFRRLSNYRFPSYINNNYDLLNKGFYLDYTYQDYSELNSYLLYAYDLEIEITADLTYYDVDDPADRALVENNWVLYARDSYIYKDASLDTKTKIYEVSNGVEVYKFDPFA